jgi:hypothetical protein
MLSVTVVSLALAFIPLTFVRWLQKAEISLAWFALLWVFVAWMQGYGGVWGVMAMVDNTNPTRNNETKNKVFNNTNRHKISSLVYWLGLAFMLFIGIQLAVGTFRSYKEDTNLSTQIRSLIESEKIIIGTNQDLVKSNQETTQQIQKSNQDLIDRIDALISQIGAQNVTGNTTITTK